MLHGWLILTCKSNSILLFILKTSLLPFTVLQHLLMLLLFKLLRVTFILSNSMPSNVQKLGTVHFV